MAEVSSIKNIIRDIIKTLTGAHVLAYLTIFIVLWFTKGMTEPHQTGIPYPSIILFICFGFLIYDAVKHQAKITRDYIFKPIWILLIEMVFLTYASFSKKYNLHHFSITQHLNWFHLLILISLGLIILSIFIKKYRTLLYSVILFLSCLLAIVIIYCSIDPQIDTHLFLNMASDYFMDGKNPYSYNYPDIYQGKYAEVYGNKFYFNYWPLPLYIIAGFRWLFNDVRYAFVVSQLIFAWIILRYKKDQSMEQNLLFAIIWLLNMVVGFVNERSWLDALTPPFFLLSIIWMHKKKYLGAAILIGLMASLKLYYIFVIPFFAIYLIREKRIKEIFVMGIAFCISFIPFVLWSFKDFYYSSFTFISNTEVREDSLSLISVVKKFYMVDLSSIGTIIMFGLMALFFVLYWRGKNNVIQLLKYSSLCLFGIFLFSKQAFCNYFYFNMLSSFIIVHLQANFLYGKEE